MSIQSILSSIYGTAASTEETNKARYWVLLAKGDTLTSEEQTELADLLVTLSVTADQSAKDVAIVLDIKRDVAKVAAFSTAKEDAKTATTALQDATDDVKAAVAEQIRVYKLSEDARARAAAYDNAVNRVVGHQRMHPLGYAAVTAE